MCFFGDEKHKIYLPYSVCFPDAIFIFGEDGLMFFFWIYEKYKIYLAYSICFVDAIFILGGSSRALSPWRKRWCGNNFLPSF